MPFFSQDFLESLSDKADIVDVISDYVTLKNSGRSYVGLCPFHREKTPSFHVDADKQLFHCFGCQASGNVYTFIMKIENLDFVEAVKFLANRVNMPLPEENGQRGVSREKKARLLEANRRGFWRRTGRRRGFIMNCFISPKARKLLIIFTAAV